MIRQIEEKVVNRLRQVTSAIKQAGANQVSVITSSAEREAAIEFAKAAAIRPATLGAGAAGDRAGAGGGKRAVRDSGDAEAAGKPGAPDASRRGPARPRAAGFAGRRQPRRSSGEELGASDAKTEHNDRFFGRVLLRAKELLVLNRSFPIGFRSTSLKYPAYFRFHYAAARVPGLRGER